MANISVSSPSLDGVAKRLLALVELDGLVVLRAADVVARLLLERRDRVLAHLRVLVEPRGPGRQPAVTALERGDRYSIAFFYSPNVDAVIECVPSCVAPDNPPRYAPAVYRDLVLAFYNANYFHRKEFAGRPAS